MSITALVHGKDSLEAWLTAWIARELDMPADQIEVGKSLLNYSLSSVTAMMLVGDLEEELGLTLPPTLVWDYPSIAAIADYLVGQLATRAADGPEAAAGAGPDALDGLSDQEVDALLARMMAGGPGVGVAS